MELRTTSPKRLLCIGIPGLGFRVWGLGFTGLGFWVSGFRVLGLGPFREMSPKPKTLDKAWEMNFPLPLQSFRPTAKPRPDRGLWQLAQ